MGEHFILFTNA
jgi:hypothetical protein